MASTAHKTDLEKKEYFDEPEVLEKKIEELAELIKKSKHFVVFTGAGISTATGIPDFRSGMDTVLKTGPGLWEEKAQKKLPEKEYERKEMLEAVPSLSHMALVKLESEGILKFIVSQNVDGLHLKSGIPSKRIAELHGNSNLEKCRNKKCLRQYLRDFEVLSMSGDAHNHRTGRKCENCGEELHDSIINFGENLPEKELRDGFAQCAAADLCLVLGSSLKVTPAAHMPIETLKNGGKLFIVNLQSTPLDKNSTRINGMIDVVMDLLMKKLELEIPKFTLTRRMKILKSKITSGKNKGKQAIQVRGVDEEGNPFFLFPKITYELEETGEKVKIEGEPATWIPEKGKLDLGKISIKLKFQEWYGEPKLKFNYDLGKLEDGIPKYLKMEYDFEQKTWTRLKEFVL